MLSRLHCIVGRKRSQVLPLLPLSPHRLGLLTSYARLYDKALMEATQLSSRASQLSKFESGKHGSARSLQRKAPVGTAQDLGAYLFEREPAHGQREYQYELCVRVSTQYT